MPVNVYRSNVACTVRVSQYIICSLRTLCCILYVDILNLALLVIQSRSSLCLQVSSKEWGWGNLFSSNDRHRLEEPVPLPMCVQYAC